MDDARRGSALLRADEDYRRNISPHYDEVLQEVTDRVATSGSIGKVDIGALVMWKRINATTPWARDLGALAEAEVRRITEAAVAAARDESLTPADGATAARRALATLPGCRSGDALASALLTAAAPARMAVYDRRARQGLKILEVDLLNGRGRYGRYIGAAS